MSQVRKRRGEDKEVKEATAAKKDESRSRNVLTASAKGASYLILLQLFTRLLTFTFNQLILRRTSPSIFGFASIQLELVSSTVLFLCREGVRIASQRDRGDIQRTVNLAYIPLLAGIFGSGAGYYLFWRSAGGEVRALGGFESGIVLYGIATVVELTAEPAFAVVQQQLLFQVRTLAEGLAVVARCAVTYIATINLANRGLLDKHGALPFGLGQLAYAMTLTAVYVVAISRKVNLLPWRLEDKDNKKSYYFHTPTFWLALSVTGQSLFKHVLTEGDKLVLTILTAPYTQGIYGVVSNYGSLIARILFQPLEETLRTVLSSVLSSPDRQPLDQSFFLLRTLLKLYVLFSMIIIAIIPPFIPSLILPIFTILLGSDKYPPEALHPIIFAYLFYIPIMAINGVCESFIASVATPRDLAKQSRAMVIFSIVFLGISWALLKQVGMGAEALVWANCINLANRITWSLRFINKWYKDRQKEPSWKEMLPGLSSIVMSVAVGGNMHLWVFWDKGQSGWGKAIGVSVSSGLLLLMWMYVLFHSCADLDFFPRDGYLKRSGGL